MSRERKETVVYLDPKELQDLRVTVVFLVLLDPLALPVLLDFLVHKVQRVQKVHLVLLVLRVTLEWLGLLVLLVLLVKSLTHGPFALIIRGHDVPVTCRQMTPGWTIAREWIPSSAPSTTLSRRLKE